MKIIVPIIPKDFITNLLLSSLCPFLQTKNKNQIFSKLVVWYRKIFLFLSIASRALLENHVEFRNFIEESSYS